MNNPTKKQKKLNFLEKKSIAMKSIKEINCFLSKCNYIFAIKKIIKK